VIKKDTAMIFAVIDETATFTSQQLDAILQMVEGKARYFVYMVLTSRGHFYTGISTCPEIRVAEHNNGRRGAKCLRGQRPVQLAWHTPFALLKSEALKLEKKIKKLSHLEKQEIASRHPMGLALVFQDGEKP
jgi:putative endonuclease